MLGGEHTCNSTPSLWIAKMARKNLKYCSSFALTLHQMWKYQDSSVCPLCEALEEIRNHILRYPDPRANEQFWKYVAPILELLKKLENVPPVADAIMDILCCCQAKCWINHCAYPASCSISF